jgi:hypothetical protein
MSVGIGVYDLLNEKPGYIEPYQGWHPPYPGRSREVFLRVAYDRNF